MDSILTGVELERGVVLVRKKKIICGQLIDRSRARERKIMCRQLIDRSRAGERRSTD